MKLAKSMLLIGMGVGGTILYQKYSKPVMKEMEKLIDKTVNSVSSTLDDMM